MLEKSLELDLGVTQHIGIWRPPSFIFGEKMAEYTLLVFSRKVDCFQRNANDIRYGSSIDQVLAG